MDMKQLISEVQRLQDRVTALEQKLEKSQTRDRGPKSEKTMTEAHAFAVKFGELKDAKYKEAAAKLGLSYGQVFSCRGGYTFKQVTKDWKPKDVVSTKAQADAELETVKP